MNEKDLFKFVRPIALAIVRSEHAPKRRLVAIMRWKSALSGVFAILGSAGILLTKAEDFKTHGLGAAGIVTGIVSLAILILLELVRALDIEKVASQVSAAKESFSLLKEECRIALSEDNPFAALAPVKTQANSLSKMFHMVLADAALPTIARQADELTTSLVAAHGITGKPLPKNQQQRKRT